MTASRESRLAFFASASANSLEKAQATDEGSDENVEKTKVGEGQLLYEIIRQVINFTPTTSTQYGYYTYIKGIDGLFAGAPENETTAWFTFHRETTNLRVTANGPLRIHFERAHPSKPRRCVNKLSWIRSVKPSRW